MPEPSGTGAGAGQRRLQPLESGLRLDVLSTSAVTRLHERTLAVLDRVGVLMPSRRVLGVLAEAGARARYRALLGRHEPLPLDGAVQAEINRIIHAYGRQVRT